MSGLFPQVSRRLDRRVRKEASKKEPNLGYIKIAIHAYTYLFAQDLVNLYALELIKRENPLVMLFPFGSNEILLGGERHDLYVCLVCAGMTPSSFNDRTCPSHHLESAPKMSADSSWNLSA